MPNKRGDFAIGYMNSKVVVAGGLGEKCSLCFLWNRRNEQMTPVVAWQKKKVLRELTNKLAFVTHRKHGQTARCRRSVWPGSWWVDRHCEHSHGSLLLCLHHVPRQTSHHWRTFHWGAQCCYGSIDVQIRWKCPKLGTLFIFSTSETESFLKSNSLMSSFAQCGFNGQFYSANESSFVLVQVKNFHNVQAAKTFSYWNTVTSISQNVLKLTVFLATAPHFRLDSSHFISPNPSLNCLQRNCS